MHFSHWYPCCFSKITSTNHLKVKVKSCPTLCDPTDTRLLRPWDFLGKSTGVGCHFLLQGIFPTQGLNPGLPHCRQTLYCLSPQGSPTQLIFFFLRNLFNNVLTGLLPHFLQVTAQVWLSQRSLLITFHNSAHLLSPSNSSPLFSFTTEHYRDKFYEANYYVIFPSNSQQSLELKKKNLLQQNNMMKRHPETWIFIPVYL